MSFSPCHEQKNLVYLSLSLSYGVYIQHSTAHQDQRPIDMQYLISIGSLVAWWMYSWAGSGFSSSGRDRTAASSSAGQ
ncbi:hypothetical protein SETIT_8G090300v2 [Setaria italica]|uniref:Uncharacterized protein n=1 Tax=Setaria italica TaxID=4555 RepID=A0A368S5Z3_SETIT|nr:hypothetical protein SETIT_8G090300v2 [Setaria italica]